MHVGMYDQDHVPMWINSIDELAQQLATLVDWRQFGFVPSALSSERPGRDGACLYLTVVEPSLLPSWAAHDHFVLSLNFVCAALLGMTGQDSGLVLHKLHPGESVGYSVLAETAISALQQLYRPVARAGAVLIQNSSSTLDVLLPILSESVAEIYSKSHNLQFRRDMEHLTQTDDAHRMEATLRQRLQALLDPTSVSITPQAPLATHPRQDCDPEVPEEERVARSMDEERVNRLVCEEGVERPSHEERATRPVDQERVERSASVPVATIGSLRQAGFFAEDEQRSGNPPFLPFAVPYQTPVKSPRDEDDMTGEARGIPYVQHSARATLQGDEAFATQHKASDDYPEEMPSAADESCESPFANTPSNADQTGFEKFEEFHFASQEEELWFSQMEEELTF